MRRLETDMSRIVVTGMGAVSPLGCGVELAWRRLLAGQSGLRALPEWSQTLPDHPLEPFIARRVAPAR